MSVPIFQRAWRSLRSLTPRTKRIFVYVAIVLAVAAWKYLPRPWFPTVRLETQHHLILSTATREQAGETGERLEFLYLAYSNTFGSLPRFERDHSKLQVKLFKDRMEFHWIHPGLGWAEAYYSRPYCNAYYSLSEINPYHWMLHEAAHQLNAEVAHLDLAKWLEEGIADYFGSSRLTHTNLLLGKVDINTYPVWWLDELARTPDLDANIREGSVIPLRAIITNRGGPSLDKQFNLYYLHWWTLTHFVFENPRYRQQALKLTERGGNLEAFEQLIGPVERVQTEWHAYVQALKKLISKSDLSFMRSGDVSGAFDGLTNSEPRP